MSNIRASGQSFELLTIVIHVKLATSAATTKSNIVVARPGSIAVVGIFHKPFIFRLFGGLESLGQAIES